MKSKRSLKWYGLLVLIFLLSLSGLGASYLDREGIIDLPNITPLPVVGDTPVVDNADYLTCSDAINTILEEHEYLQRVEDPENIIYRRGGHDNNQFIVNFTENSFTRGHVGYSYAQFYVDEYFYYRDMSEQTARIREEAFDITGSIDLIYYGNEKKASTSHWAKFNEVKIVTESDLPFLIKDFDTNLNAIHKRLEAVGCPLKNKSPEVFNQYSKQKVSSMTYFEPQEKISDPLDVVMCSGLDCLVSDHPNYVELKNWKDVDKLPHTKLINGVEVNVGRIVVVYDNSWLTRDFIVDPMFHHVYPEDTFYKWKISGARWNPTFMQNLWRDIYLDNWRETSPLVYFVDASKAPNRKFTTGPACGTNGLTFYDWSCDLTDMIFEWIPEGTGVTPRPFGWTPLGGPDGNDVRMMVDYLNYYADLSEFEYNFVHEYLKIFNVQWQEYYGLREVYFEKYGY